MLEKTLLIIFTVLLWQGPLGRNNCKSPSTIIGDCSLSDSPHLLLRENVGLKKKASFHNYTTTGTSLFLFSICTRKFYYTFFACPIKMAPFSGTWSHFFSSLCVHPNTYNLFVEWKRLTGHLFQVLELEPCSPRPARQSVRYRRTRIKHFTAQV